MQGEHEFDSLLSDLNAEQREAVLHDEGPMLILAGAGSGKTRVITRRIAYLLQRRQVPSYAILAITFTNKAANEMKERVAELVGPTVNGMWIGTFHSMFARILRQHANLLGYTSSYTIADSSDQLQMMKQLIREQGLDEKKVEPRLMVSRISGAKNALISPAQFAEQPAHDSLHETVAKLYHLYQGRLKASNCMDFDDILVNTVKLFRQEAQVLESYQERFRYIMVDEYQDTNQAQYQIVRALSRVHENLCVVGDDDQSIYAFRGADIRNILDFEKDYKRCRIIKLEQNYRSTKTILEAANAVIAHNKKRKKKTLWTGQKEGDKIRFVRANQHFDESRYVAQAIQKRHEAGQFRYADFAILYRTNALSRGVEQALREATIPYRIYGGLRFYDRKEIKDVLAYLRLIASDVDELAFTRVINTPRRGIGRSTYEALQELSSTTGRSMLQLAGEARQYSSLSRASSALLSFANLIYQFRTTLKENRLSFVEFIEQVQEETGLLAEILNNQEKGKEEAKDRIENLKELLTDVQEFTQAFERERRALEASEEGMNLGELTLVDYLQAFLERASLYTEQDKDEEERDYVSLMTIHASKGLEFPCVFLLCMENGIFPSQRSLNELQGLEEERRLAYVAITRAQQLLYLTTARYRQLYGQTQSNPVSPFVLEIPEHCLKQIGGSTYEEARPMTYGDSYASRDGAGGFAPQTRRMSSSGSRSVSKGVDPTGLAFLKGGAIGIGKVPKPMASDREGNSSYLKPQELQNGLRVRSKAFGVGKILSFESVAGDAIVEVQFDSSPSKPKRVMLAYAKLVKED